VYAPYWVAEQVVPEVVRMHPVVSFSVVVAVLQAPLPHVYVETVRERVPLVAQVPP
jgi:hypothetical protein